MWEKLTLAEKMLVCLDLSDLYVKLARIVVLRTLFDACDDELGAAWEGFHEEHWPTDRFRMTRPGDPGFRFNDLHASRAKWWPSSGT